MTDPRYNDIACKLRQLAADLAACAADHRKLADQLDHITSTKPPADQIPRHLADLDAAAGQLVNLTAAQIRQAAPQIARDTGQQVLPVALRAQHLRAERTAAQRRRQCLAVLDALAGGDALPKAAKKAGVSNATARRLRDKWRDLGTL